jgi:hypothetical protein
MKLMFQDFPKYGVSHKFVVALKSVGETIVVNLSQIIFVISVSFSFSSAETDVSRFPEIWCRTQIRRRFKSGGKTIVGNLSQIVLVISVSFSSSSAETDVSRFPENMASHINSSSL